MLAYRLTIEPDEDAFLVTSPDFPELTSFGATPDDAASHAADALEEAIAARIADGRPLPRPLRRDEVASSAEPVTPLTLPTALKVSLYRALGERGRTRQDLARAMGLEAGQADAFLDDRLSLDRIERAFNALGTEIDFEIRDRPAA